jgi:hypothetical protein
MLGRGHTDHATALMPQNHSDEQQTAQSLEAAHHQSACAEQHARQGDLRNDHPATHPAEY